MLDDLYPKPQLATLGDRLRYARKSANMTQAQVAKLAGCAQSRVGDLELNGKWSQHIPAIAAVLGINTFWLTKGVGPMKPHNNVSELYNRCTYATRHLIDALIALDLKMPRPDLPPAAWTILDATKLLVPAESEPEAAQDADT